jgi:hypothetical protein
VSCKSKVGRCGCGNIGLKFLLWYRVEKPHHHSVKGSEPPANPLKPPAKSVKYLGSSVASRLHLIGCFSEVRFDLGHADGNGTGVEAPGRSPRVSTAQNRATHERRERLDARVVFNE